MEGAGPGVALSGEQELLSARQVLKIYFAIGVDGQHYISFRCIARQLAIYIP